MEGVGSEALAPLEKLKNDFSKELQYYLDRSTPHVMHRWLGTLGVAAIYVLRVYFVQGFYIVSYGLGIYILNLLIGFLSPKVDPELELMDGAALPTKESDEFRPFIRRLPEFKFWVLHNQGAWCGISYDILLGIRCSCVLADTRKLLDRPGFPYNEAPNHTDDQVQICSFHCWKAEIWGEPALSNQQETNG
ncbi:unnamed protein product [Linum tenue]|uniref:Uncharacterized protein n=1 Tax=Linum tenue TaxID=586396 RepID=A0AAV0LRL4_9ROSI|nr:unnamed protein product [Linum tenue]